MLGQAGVAVGEVGEVGKKRLASDLRADWPVCWLRGAGGDGGVSPDLWQKLTEITLGGTPPDLDLDRLNRLIPCLDINEPLRRVGAADVDCP